MRAQIFGSRISKEILRDPLSLFFGVAFPVVLLLLLTAINSNIPTNLFDLAALTPGIAVFSLSFIALFTAQVLSKDRSSALLTRLLTTPMKAKDFVLGYTIPLALMSIAQGIVCYISALFLGLEFDTTFLLAIVLLLPTAFIFIGIGLICGTLLSEKAAVGICGAVLTNVSAWLSGIWFDLDLVGGLFKDIAYLLPFVHAVDMGKAIVSGNNAEMFPHLWWVLAYAGVIFILSVMLFNKKIQED